jgi:hypothetical protein
MITIRRIGVFSLGKFLGILYGLLGLILGLITSGFSFLGILLGGSYSSSSYTYGSAFFTLGAIICFPILYGIGGFIGGIITGWVANIALKFSDGLELEADAKAIQAAPIQPGSPPIEPLKSLPPQ